MAKLKNDPIGPDDIAEYLKSCSDFSFELEVLKMLREHDIECEHGGHYEDPVTGKSREFDIRAKKTIKSVRVRMAFECKNIRENSPILVSCVPRHVQEAYHQIAMVSEPAFDSRVMLPTLDRSRARIVNIGDGYSLYPEGKPVGKSTTQIGRALDGSISATDKELYEKWGQCLSSANDLIKRMYWDGDDDDPENAYLSTVLPYVVVPNGRLWSVNYDEDGHQARGPEQVNRCSCFIDKDYVMGTQIAHEKIWLSHLEIVTFDGLCSFVEEYFTTLEGIKRIFPGEC